MVESNFLPSSALNGIPEKKRTKQAIHPVVHRFASQLFTDYPQCAYSPSILRAMKAPRPVYLEALFESIKNNNYLIFKELCLSYIDQFFDQSTVQLVDSPVKSPGGSYEEPRLSNMILDKMDDLASRPNRRKRIDGKQEFVAQINSLMEGFMDAGYFYLALRRVLKEFEIHQFHLFLDSASFLSGWRLIHAATYYGTSEILSFLVLMGVQLGVNVQQAAVNAPPSSIVRNFRAPTQTPQPESPPQRPSNGKLSSNKSRILLLFLIIIYFLIFIFSGIIILSTIHNTLTIPTIYSTNISNINQFPIYYLQLQ